jgi:hypothetical protein
MQLPPYSRNGARDHPVPAPAPRSTGSFLHRTPGGVMVRIQTWLIPGVGNRWYVHLAGVYLSTTGYDAHAIDGAVGFANPEGARAAADLWESKVAVLAPREMPMLEAPVDEVEVSQGAVVLDASLRYRSRGEVYEIEGWRHVDTGLLSWTVRKGLGLYLKPPDARGGPMGWALGIAGAVEFATPAEAQAAITGHVERDEAAEAASRLRALADRVARGELFVRFQPADSTGDEVAIITKMHHQPGSRTS